VLVDYLWKHGVRVNIDTDAETLQRYTDRLNNYMRAIAFSLGLQETTNFQDVLDFIKTTRRVAISMGLSEAANIRELHEYMSRMRAAAVCMGLTKTATMDDVRDDIEEMREFLEGLF
jgi:hypothetical protein